MIRPQRAAATPCDVDEAFGARQRVQPTECSMKSRCSLWLKHTWQPRLAWPATDGTYPRQCKTLFGWLSEWWTMPSTKRAMAAKVLFGMRLPPVGPSLIVGHLKGLKLPAAAARSASHPFDCRSATMLAMATVRSLC